MHYTTQAADMSYIASIEVLREAFKDGKFGFPVNPVESRRWFMRVLQYLGSILESCGANERRKVRFSGYLAQLNR